MKQFSNNPPTPFADLTAAEKHIAIQKMAIRHDMQTVTLVSLIYHPDRSYNPDVDFEFYPLNNDVAVKEKGNGTIVEGLRNAYNKSKPQTY